MWSCSLGLFKDCRFFKFFFQQIIHKSSDFVSLNLSCFQSFKRTLNDLFKITCMLILSEYSSFVQKSFSRVSFCNFCLHWVILTLQGSRTFTKMSIMNILFDFNTDYISWWVAFSFLIFSGIRINMYFIYNMGHLLYMGHLHIII